MGCGCKKKNKVTETKSNFTWDEVVIAMTIINHNIQVTNEQKEYLYELHNRIFPKNKQLNVNCNDCFKLVLKNIIRYYESNR